VVPRPLFAAALVVHRRYLIVVPGPLPAAPLVVRCSYLIVVPRPFPAAALVARRKYLDVAPGRCPRRRSLFFAVTFHGTGLLKTNGARKKMF
jgi:hypothetical protein